MVVSALAQYIGCHGGVRSNQRLAQWESSMRQLRALLKSGSFVKELRRVKIEVHGQDAVQATDELLNIEEFKGSS